MNVVRVIASLVVVPATLAVAGTALIDARSGNIGLGAVPFIFVGYLIGLTLGTVFRVVAPQWLCLCIAVTAVVVCLVGVTQGSNILSWLLIPAIGGVVAELPDVRLPRSMRVSPR